jgi:hypothetical protein
MQLEIWFALLLFGAFGNYEMIGPSTIAKFPPDLNNNSEFSQ